MKKAGLALLSAFALAAAAFALPAVNHSALSVVHQDQAQNAQQTQSVSGTIASVEKDSFTLTVTSSPSPKAQSFAQDSTPKTMTFQIDKNTTVDGTLKVKATADVVYRADESGKNIAISVRVTPAP